MTETKTAKLTKAVLEQLAIDEPCTECEVLPGAKCVSKVSGKEGAALKHPHTIRIEAAQIAASRQSDVDELAAQLQAATEGETEGDAPADETAEPVLVTECEACGYKFSKPQKRTTCQVPAACAKRAAAKAAEATA